MNAAEAKASPYWPDYVGPTVDVQDRRCPMDRGYVFMRPDQPALYVANPLSSDITYILVCPIDDVREIVDELMRTLEIVPVPGLVQ